MRDCLLYAFYKLGWIDKPSQYYQFEYIQYNKVEDQLLKMKQISKVEFSVTSEVTLNSWEEVIQYTKDCGQKYGDGVLLVWFNDNQYWGHAMPVINGEQIWAPQYYKYVAYIRLANKYLCRYIYKDE